MFKDFWWEPRMAKLVQAAALTWQSLTLCLDWNSFVRLTTHTHKKSSRYCLQAAPFGEAGVISPAEYIREVASLCSQRVANFCRSTLGTREGYVSVSNSCLSFKPCFHSWCFMVHLQVRLFGNSWIPVEDAVFTQFFSPSCMYHLRYLPYSNISVLPQFAPSIVNVHHLTLILLATGRGANAETICSSVPIFKF